MLLADIVHWRPIASAYSENCRATPGTNVSPSLREGIQLYKTSTQMNMLNAHKTSHWYVSLPPQSSWPIGIHSEWYNTDDNRKYQIHNNVNPEERICACSMHMTSHLFEFSIPLTHTNTKKYVLTCTRTHLYDMMHAHYHVYTHICIYTHFILLTYECHRV